jgi:hypothetical protein
VIKHLSFKLVHHHVVKKFLDFDVKFIVWERCSKHSLHFILGAFAFFSLLWVGELDNFCRVRSWNEDYVWNTFLKQWI